MHNKMGTMPHFLTLTKGKTEKITTSEHHHLMINESNINKVSVRGPGQGVQPQGDRGRTGNWRGETIKLRSPVNDVDDKLQTERLARSVGITAPTVGKQLSQLTIALEQKSTGFSTSAIGDYTDAVGSNARTSKLAKSYLSHLSGDGPKPQPGNGTGELMRDYLALQKLAAALRGNDSDFVALLTPMKDRISNFDELAEKLQQAGEDSEKMGAILAEVGGMPDNNEGLYQLMKTLRFKPDQLKQKLRDAQNLPELSRQDKEALLERVEDEIKERERSHGSRIHASLNALGSARESGHAETFIEGYNDLVLDSSGFSNALTTLLKRYKPDELRNVLPLMKQALADDLNAEPRSTDKTKLEMLLSDLSHMHISTTLLSMTTQLISGLRRLYGSV